MRGELKIENEKLKIGGRQNVFANNKVLPLEKLGRLLAGQAGL